MDGKEEHLREIAARMWECRKDLEAELIPGDPEGIRLHGGDTMKAPDTTVLTMSNGLTVRMTDAWNGCSVNLKVQVEIGGDTITFEGPTLIHRAFQAMQCAEVLEVLGESVPDVPGVFAYPRKQPLLHRLLRRKRPTDTLGIVRPRMIRKIEEVTDASGVVEADGMCRIGNEVSILARYHPARWEEQYEAWVFHPQIGTIDVPMYYSNIKSVIDKVCSRAMQRITLTTQAKAPVSIAASSRSSELLRIGHLAIGADPDLVDANGARMDTLIREHLPELLTRHRRASTTAVDEENRSRVEAEFNDGLDVVAAALDEAMTIRGSQSHEDLLTQVRFLKTRHGATPLTL